MVWGTVQAMYQAMSRQCKYMYQNTFWYIFDNLKHLSFDIVDPHLG